jgi:hypothetical protein
LENDREDVQRKISGLLSWERRKRRETIVVAALFYALLSAPVLVVLSGAWVWVAPAVIFIGFALCLLLLERWRDRDTARALAAVDKSLQLDERTTTAWEILCRNENTAVAQLVLRQTWDGLKALEPRALFPRRWSWHGYFIAPLLALWLAVIWHGPGFDPADSVPDPQPSLSQKLREYARLLQERAQSESLPRTLEAGRRLEKAAQRSMDSKTANDQFKKELAGLAQEMAAERKAASRSTFDGVTSRQQLEDLRAELEAARDLMNPANGAGQALEDRLSGLNQLSKQLDKQKAQGLGPGEMKSFLDKLEQQVAGELDRRTLLEAEQFLQQLAESGQRQSDETQASAGGQKQQEPETDATGERKAGSAPGEEVGKDLGKAPSLPEFQGGTRADVKGKIGEGERSGIYFKAKPIPGKSQLSQDEVIASYRRQAEAELNSERIPPELKETIKNYFLSLEKPDEKPGL